MRFLRKRTEDDSLVAPNIEDFSSWIQYVINTYNLHEGAYTLTAGIGGFLLFIDGQGITWIPYDTVKRKLRQIEKKDLAIPTAIGSGVALVSILQMPITSLFVANVVLKKVTKLFLVNPPKSIRRYFLSEIEAVRVKAIRIKNWQKFLERDESIQEDSFDINEGIERIKEIQGFEKLVKILEQMEDSKEVALQINIQTVLDSEQNAIIDKFIRTTKKLLLSNSKETLVFPIQPNLLFFLAELDRKGLPLYFE